jgi:hypothetical protein
MLTSAQIDYAVTTRARVQISPTNGWAAGTIGIAMGYNNAYGTIKVGFIDADGQYTGDYTKVSYKDVSLVTETSEKIDNDLRNAGYLPAVTISGRTYGGFRIIPQVNGDTLVEYTIGNVVPQPPEDTHRDIVGVRIHRMEWLLSRKGHKVTVFEPETGTGFWLKIV